VKITSLILILSGGMLPAALLLTALACLILGMEVPTTAAYVICISGGRPGAAATWGCSAAGGTPVRVLVRASVDHHAAGLRHGLHCRRHGGENWLKVIIPLTMVANPAIMGLASEPVAALLALVQIGLGLALISYALIGVFTPLRRAALGLAGFAVLFGPAMLG
jgi:TRAP-type uncharacterized transport system fused permease subunit